MPLCPVRGAVQAQLAKACALWEQHVSLPAAPYVAQAKATAAKVEGEIKVALTTHATKVRRGPYVWWGGGGGGRAETYACS